MMKLLHILLLNIKPGPPKAQEKAEHIRQVKGTISKRAKRQGNTARRPLQAAAKPPRRQN